MKMHSLLLLGALSLTACAHKPAATTKPAPDPVKAAVTPAPAMKHFGADATTESLQTVSIETLLEKPEAYADQPLKITGTVKSVCAKRGCWLQLGSEDPAKALFVKFTCPIDGRLIPMEAVGKPAVVQGKVKITEMSEAQARHYKKDGGATSEEIEKIVGPQKRIIVASPAADIAGLD